ncbi:hypothetical protein GCM10007079_29740 [Nocardiopsis terrae]|uniref:Cytochrome b561 n=1 Tax=Nocardiopsis terrae TaxID=372655 RepID=A0ABR9HIY2_9ACTN|nr:DUF2306 domain-containing protein [Nocardiopsis terrae]MBE1458805.1 cytochrome b561 [Nocardiopsis terrae]GHC86427.1 hypothetical protein GCM10007079_29740 [Nocardiopsis terrae]
MTRTTSDSRHLTAAPPTDTASRRPPPKPSPARWWERPWILPLALFSVTFLLFAVPPYLSLDPADSRLPVPESPSWYFPVLVIHVFGGALITLLVILQVWPWLRTRHPAVHRWSGRVYVLAGLPLVGVPAMLIAPFSEAGASAQISGFVWAALWSAFTVLGYVKARRRRFADHREWMLRSFALVYGIAFNRVLHVLLVMITAPRVDTVYGGDFEAMSLDLGAASGFLSWILPLLFVEWWIKYRKPRRRSRRARTTDKRTASPASPAEPDHSA